jgi:hypothetical protein
MGGTGARRGPVCEVERERDGVAVGHRHAGPGGTVLGGAVQTGFEKNPNSNGSKQF